MSTDDRDDLVPTDTTTDTTTDATAEISTDAPDLTIEEEPTMSSTTPPRTSAWTTDTSTLDQPAADETPTAAFTAETPTATYPADTAAPAGPAVAPAGTPVASVPFPRTLDQPRGVRVGTVVWGLVVTAVAVGLLALANGATFDVQLATIVVIAGAGVALLVGSLVGTRRRHG